MPTSEARILANRKNAALSTGPRSPEGKERSRANGLTHGMAGRGVVIPEDDAAEVDLRNAALRAELAPKSALGAILVGQMATLSVRMERGARQEFAAVAARVRHAEDDFDEDRIARAEELLKTIGDDPRGNRRRLLKSPEGVDLLVQAWEDLRADLTGEPKPRWTAGHMVTAANLLGLRDVDARGSRVGALSRGVWGDFEALGDHEGPAATDEARKAWARARLVERIDEELADLKAHVEALDLEAIELDRAEAGARALFDPSREASLARRYESEARRGFFRALDQFRQAEAEAEAAGRAVASPSPSASPAPTPSPAPLGSSRDRPSDHPPAPARRPFEDVPPASRAISDEPKLVRAPDGPPSKIGRPAQGAA